MAHIRLKIYTLTLWMLDYKFKQGPYYHIKKIGFYFHMKAVKPLTSVKKFYFLEYFYVLLKSVEKYKTNEQVFHEFKELKQKYRLGESKYKKLTENPKLTKTQLDRYRYTFEQVIEEAKNYDLIKEAPNGNLQLTNDGDELLFQYNKGGQKAFNLALFEYMEKTYNAFNYLIKFLYKANKFKPGLLVFPSYSPRQLNFERSEIKTTKNIIDYSKTLIKKLQDDILEYLGEKRDLKKENDSLIEKLMDINLLPRNPNEKFDQTKYNSIIKRFRDNWTGYFLKEIYGYKHSMASFDIWTYRGKQIGIIYATEFYPYFNGKIVYPTSIILKNSKSKDFKSIFEYQDTEKIYMHKPNMDANQNDFVDCLVKSYFDLRPSNRSDFINLIALRELVCYSMKISESIFQDFLNKIYKLNLIGELRIGISLEVDRLPEETKAMYLKREPVMVDGKYRNIIAIDVTKEKEEISNEKPIKKAFRKFFG